jgi:hypothetical protein
MSLAQAYVYRAEDLLRTPALPSRLPAPTDIQRIRALPASGWRMNIDESMVLTESLAPAKLAASGKVRLFIGYAGHEYTGSPEALALAGVVPAEIVSGEGTLWRGRYDYEREGRSWRLRRYSTRLLAATRLYTAAEKRARQLEQKRETERVERLFEIERVARRLREVPASVDHFRELAAARAAQGLAIALCAVESAQGGYRFTGLKAKLRDDGFSGFLNGLLGPGGEDAQA